MSKQAAPVRSCRMRVEGGVVAYECRLAEGHLGPCCAIELPRSMEARRVWESNHATAAPLRTVAPGAVVALPSDAVMSEPERLAFLESMLGRKFFELPQAVRDWAMSMMAYTSLGALYRIALGEFEAGAETVSIDRELLDRLVPAVLRHHLGLNSPTTPGAPE